MPLKARSVELVRTSQPELEERADSLAHRLGMSRTAAFKKMDAGKLPRTIVATELKLVRHLMAAELPDAAE